MKIYMQDGSDAVMTLPPGPDLKLPNCATLRKFQAVYFEQRFDDEHAGRPATGAARKGAGPCSGDACMFVNVMTQSNCVWLRSSSREAVNAEVRLEKETFKIALEGADMAKVKKSAVEENATRRLGGDAGRADASRRVRDELRREGTYIPYDPKIDGPRDAPVKPTEKQDEGQSWHGTVYNALTSSDQPVFNARVATAAGCLGDPEAIVSYAVNFASSKTPTTSVTEPKLVPCSGQCVPGPQSQC